MLVLSVLAIYGQTLGFGFIRYDDPRYVLDNPWVQRGLSWDGLRWAFTSFHDANWFPLTWLSLMLDVEIAGVSARMFHATNLLLHAASSLLLFQLLDRATGARWKSAWVAVLFAVHPLHVESVAWISERKDVLSALFWLLTMWLWLRWTERPGALRYALVIASFALGLLSKPMLVTLPFVLLLFDFWPLGRTREASLGSLVREKLPLLGLTAASSAVTLMAQLSGGAVASLEAYPLAPRLVNAVLAYAAYLRQTFWPTGLAILYPLPGSDVTIASGLPAALVLAAIALLAALGWRSRPYLAVGWLWYLGTLVPVIGILQVGLQAQADRYTYLPLIGVFIMLAWGVPDLLARLRPPRAGPRLLATGALATAVAALWLAHLQCGYWRDSIRLFERTVAVTGENPIARANLASSYYQRNEPGDTERARVHFAEALRIDPHFTAARNGLAGALMKLGRVEEAIEHWSAVVAEKPKARGALCNLCGALAQAGRFAEAEKRCREALGFERQALCGHLTLGLLYLRQERILDAESHFDAALELDPSNPEARDQLTAIRERPQERR
jgi:tetratricopeptide (TPR) repeat protein